MLTSSDQYGSLVATGKNEVLTYVCFIRINPCGPPWESSPNSKVRFPGALHACGENPRKSCIPAPMLPPQPITSIQYCCSTKCADVCFWWKPQEQQREPCTLNMSRSRVPVCVCIRFYLIRQSVPSSLFPDLSLLVFSVFSVLLCLPNTVSRFTSCLFVYLNSVQLHLVFLPFPLPLSARVYL